jgi:hypothetical protein
LNPVAIAIIGLITWSPIIITGVVLLLLVVGT